MSIGKQESSWRDRRWKLFESEYASNPKLKAALEPYKKRADKFQPPSLDQLLPKCGVPAVCALSVELFLSDPNLPRNEYLKLILPPISFINVAADRIGPTIWDWQEKYQGEVWKDVALSLEEVSEDMGLTSEDIKTIAKKLYGDSTVMRLPPFLQRTELHELIDEYWDSLEPLLTYRNPEIDSFYLNRLTKKIRLAAPNLVKRDKRIMELHTKGLNATEVHWKLRDEKLASNVLTPANIRVIISRLKKKEKED